MLSLASVILVLIYWADRTVWPTTWAVTRTFELGMLESGYLPRQHFNNSDEQETSNDKKLCSYVGEGTSPGHGSTQMAHI